MALSHAAGLVLLGFLLIIAAATWQFGPPALAGGGLVVLAVGMFGVNVDRR